MLSALLCIRLLLRHSRLYNQSLDPPLLPTNFYLQRYLVPNRLLVLHASRGVVSDNIHVHYGFRLSTTLTLLDADQGNQGNMHRRWPILRHFGHH